MNNPLTKLIVRTPLKTSSRRKSGSSKHRKHWIPAFAGMTKMGLLEVPVIVLCFALTAINLCCGSNSVNEKLQMSTAEGDGNGEVDISDLDGDGIPDDTDADMDGDGVDNEKEAELFSDPKVKDIIFVIYTGDDYCDGSKKCPLKTLEKALEVAKRRYNSFNERYPYTILLGSGWYEINDSIELVYVQSIYGGFSSDFSDGTGISTLNFKAATADYLIKVSHIDLDDISALQIMANVVLQNLQIEHPYRERYIKAISTEHFGALDRIKLVNNIINGTVEIKGDVNSIDLVLNFIIGSNGGRKFTNTYTISEEEITNEYSSSGTVLIEQVRERINVTGNTFWGGADTDTGGEEPDVRREQRVFEIGYHEDGIWANDYEIEVSIEDNFFGCGEIYLSCEPLVIQGLFNPKTLIIKNNILQKLNPSLDHPHNFYFNGAVLNIHAGILEFDGNQIDMPSGDSLCGVYYWSPLGKNISMSALFSGNKIESYDKELQVGGFCFGGAVGNVVLSENTLLLSPDSIEVSWLHDDTEGVENGTIDAGDLELVVW